MPPKKNQPPKKRIEYRGKHLRVSRTGGISATKTIKGDGYGATTNTKDGLRLHKRLFKGMRLGLQNGNLQFIGGYNSGPFNFNLSKSGVSTSIKNKRGTYNLMKPNYSSFNLAGVQLRGKNAAIFFMNDLNKKRYCQMLLFGHFLYHLKFILQRYLCHYQ